MSVNALSSLLPALTQALGGLGGGGLGGGLGGALGGLGGGATASPTASLQSQLFAVQLAQTNPDLYNMAFGPGLDNLQQRLAQDPFLMPGRNLIGGGGGTPFIFSVDDLTPALVSSGGFASNASAGLAGLGGLGGLGGGLSPDLSGLGLSPAAASFVPPGTQLDIGSSAAAKYDQMAQMFSVILPIISSLQGLTGAQGGT